MNGSKCTDGQACLGFCLLQQKHFSHSMDCIIHYIVPVKQIFLGKNYDFFLLISINMCFGCSKKRLIEMALLSTHNICFG